MRQVAAMEMEVEAARQELSNYSANDPERYEALSKYALPYFLAVCSIIN